MVVRGAVVLSVILLEISKSVCIKIYKMIGRHPFGNFEFLKFVIKMSSSMISKQDYFISVSLYNVFNKLYIQTFTIPEVMDIGY
jgi:hypothetical protein